MPMHYLEALIPEELYAEFEHEYQRLALTKSEMIRRCISRYFADQRRMKARRELERRNRQK